MGYLTYGVCEMILRTLRKTRMTKGEFWEQFLFFMMWREAVDHLIGWFGGS